MAKRIPQLDGLRALAILAVFVGHSLKVRMMWMGVDLFFVLSGFLITSILLDVPKVSFTSYIGAFYARRVRRILPPFLLLLVVVSVVFGVAWLKHWYMYFGLMNYREFFHDEILTGPLASLWSLGVEEQFYFFWPVLVYFVAPKKLPGILLGLMILAPVLRGVLTPWAEHQAWNQYHWFFLSRHAVPHGHTGGRVAGGGAVAHAHGEDQARRRVGAGAHRAAAGNDDSAEQDVWRDVHD